MGYISDDISHPDIKVLSSGRMGTKAHHYISVDISHLYIKVLSSGRMGTRARLYISVDISHPDTALYEDN